MTLLHYKVSNNALGIESPANMIFRKVYLLFPTVFYKSSILYEISNPRKLFRFHILVEDVTRILL